MNGLACWFQASKYLRIARSSWRTLSKLQRPEEVGRIERHKGYRTRKLRLEIIPGLQTVAILFEPDRPAAKAPAISPSKAPQIGSR